MRVKLQYLKCIAPLMLAASASACLGEGKPADSEDSSTPGCPSDLQSFCEYEFGGPCPTFQEAEDMTCDGYHFDTTGSGTPAESFSHPEDECPPRVVCMGGPNERTRLYFESTSGELEGVMAEWPANDACPGTATYGQLWC